MICYEAFREAESYQNSSYPIDKGLLYNNNLYRSKGEIKIARILDSIGLEYKYEPQLFLSDGPVFPDFWVHQRETHNCVILEYGGMLDSQKYYDHLAYKRNRYRSSGLREGIDVIFINEYSDLAIEDELISTLVLSALEQSIVLD